MENYNEIERERVIFIRGLSEEKAKELSEEYPNIFIFSEGIPYSDDIENNVEDIEISDITIGNGIYKDGIRYNLINGVKPNSYIGINGNKLSLAIDKNGLLRLKWEQH